MTLKVGDVVRLKSGGPNMTVTAVGQINDDFHEISVWCTWFPAPDNRMTAVLPIDAVELIEKQ